MYCDCDALIVMNQQHFNAVFNRLTERRREVLLKLLANETDEAIANSLHIQKSTVRKHREEICKLFGLNNEFSDERRSKLPELISLFAKYKPELLNQNTSDLPQTENFSEDKTISENPDFVGREDAIANSIPENHLAELLRILQGMQQQEQKPISSANLISIPPTLDNWQGRNAEIKELQTWLVDTKVKTLGIQGLSGVGKSWLASYMFESTDFEAKFWADVRQGTDFTVFAQNALMKLAGTSPEQLAALREPEQLIFALLDTLKKRPCLLVIDNLETLLDQDRHFIGIYKDFFIRWIENGVGSKLLLTTQTQPEVMEGHGYWLPLQGLEAINGARLLQRFGIVGSDEELQDFSKYLNGHPKMLRLVASKLKSGNHIKEAEKIGFRQLDLLLNKVPMPYRDRERIFFVWILEQHFENLASDLKCFFLSLSLYRSSFNQDAATVVLNNNQLTSKLILNDRLSQGSLSDDEISSLKGFDVVKISTWGMVLTNLNSQDLEDPNNYWQTQQAINELTSRSLLDVINEEQQFQFHPFVLHYARQKIGNQQDSLRDRIITYYASIAKIGEEWQKLEDVMPHLEVIYHLCQQKKYVIAFDTLRLCKGFLDSQGYYSIQMELYENLVFAWESNEENRLSLAAIMIDLGSIYTRMGQYQKAINILQKALLIEREISNKQGEAAALNNLGLVYQDIGNYQQSIYCHQQQLEIANIIGDSEEQANALNNLGIVCYALGKYSEAIDYQEQKVKILQNNGDLEREASTLGNLGGAYCALGEYQKVLDCHSRQLEIAQSMRDKPMEARALGSLGVVYNQLNQPEKAIELIQQSLDIAKEIGEPELQADCLLNLSNSYLFLGKLLHMQALKYCKESLKVSEQTGRDIGAARALYNLGNLFVELGEKSEAVNAYQKASALFKSMGIDKYVNQANDAIQRLS